MPPRVKWCQVSADHPAAPCPACCPSLSYHDGGDDGDEGVAVGQQSVGGLGAAVALSVERRDALCVAPRALLLHLLLDMVLYDVAVVVARHGGGATGAQRT